jgi:hypothetical protein
MCNIPAALQVPKVSTGKGLAQVILLLLLAWWVR